MSKSSKAYREADEKIDHNNLYTPLEAAKLAKETSSKKQDATVEVAIRLGVDPRKADQMVRGTVNLPNGTGKTARVIVFATGPAAEAAIAAGADEVGGAELIKKAAGVQKGSPTPHTVKVAKLTRAQVRTIAEQKQVDLNANDVEAAMKIIAGTARSMGITVEA